MPAEVACAAPPDAAFDAFIAQLSGEKKAAFVCASSPAQSLAARLLPVQAGLMLHLDGATVLVDMLDAGWQRVETAWKPGDPEPSASAPAGLYTPTAIFGAAWEQATLQDVVGFALQPDATSFAARRQKFPGGTLVADLDAGTIYAFLAGDDQTP